MFFLIEQDRFAESAGSSDEIVCCVLAHCRTARHVRRRPCAAIASAAVHRSARLFPASACRATAPAALLPQMAAALDASADDLLGIKQPIKKGKKPDTQLKLDPKAKRQITQLLDTFIEREELKQRVSAQGS
jgi:hypothetical protein